MYLNCMVHLFLVNNIILIVGLIINLYNRTNSVLREFILWNALSSRLLSETHQI